MPQSVKHLLLMLEDVSFIFPEPTLKVGLVMQAYRPITEEVETGGTGLLEASVPESVTSKFSDRSTPPHTHKTKYRGNKRDICC